jgi:YbbR domain-containing protein
MKRPVLPWAKRAARLITHNFVWKLLALAGAVVIWVSVASEPELSTFTTVSLEFRNLPSDLEISSMPVEAVTLELRGPAGELRGSGENRRPAVVLDMADVLPGVRTYPVGGGNVNLPRGVHLVQAFPSEVRFNFERRVTREVPVQVRFSGGDSGSVVAGYTVSPGKLEIEGPASRVARVAAALIDPIPVPSGIGTTQIRVNAFVSDSYVRFNESPQVLVTVTTSRPGR